MPCQGHVSSEATRVGQEMSAVKMSCGSNCPEHCTTSCHSRTPPASFRVYHTLRLPYHHDALTCEHLLLACWPVAACTRLQAGQAPLPLGRGGGRGGRIAVLRADTALGQGAEGRP